MLRNNRLELVFLTDTGAAVTISVQKPLADLTAEQIKAAMDGMIASGAYQKSTKGRLKTPRSAVLQIVDVTTLV